MLEDVGTGTLVQVVDEGLGLGSDVVAALFGGQVYTEVVGVTGLPAGGYLEVQSSFEHSPQAQVVLQ